ncbi:MAG: nuclear transport factor 2 family protein [Rubrobacter sp.]|nr:nuclear transport factor 2 family protein [Rubrobacter sp.]
MPSENVAIVREVYEAFNRGDLPAVWSLMDPGVSLVGPPVSRMPYTGFHSGPRSVTVALFRYEADLWKEFRAVPESFLYTDESVVVLGRFQAVGRESGETICIPFFHECSLCGGRIDRVHSYPAAARAMGMPD